MAGPSEVVVDGLCAEERPEFGPANRGVCKYPFDQLEVGHGLRVYGRDPGTIRGAVKRWQGQDKARRSMRFEIWRTRDQDKRACIRVKRVK